MLTAKLEFRNYGPNGDITDRKTRLCVHGYKHLAGVAYNETSGQQHSPVFCHGCTL
jgi:hypothetical protein